MSETADYLAPPRVALIGAAVLALGAFAAALLGRAEIGSSRMPDSPIVASRTLTIINEQIGASSVFDAKSGKLIRATKPGVVEDGFVWGAVNGLSYGRKQVGGALDAPYDLALREDGRLTLTDTITGQRVVLTSFGSNNAAVFARLLDAPTMDQSAEAHR